MSSTGALALERVPERLAVIGGGYIGLELGSVWARLGAKVTVIEFLDRILPGMDRELGPALQRTLARSGMAFRLGTKVVCGVAGNEGVTLEIEPAAGGERDSLSCRCGTRGNRAAAVHRGSRSRRDRRRARPRRAGRG